MWNPDEVRDLSHMCGAIHAYSLDGDDEFTVSREDNIVQGVFKSWAVPVIPFLDTGTIDILSSLWPKLINLTGQMSFYDALEVLKGDPDTEGQARRVDEILSAWRKSCSEYPLRLKRSLESARLHSCILDRRLAEVFVKEPVFRKIPQRITQLITRLQLAFGLQNPFYDLEALAADPRLLREEIPLQSSSHAGRLDAVAFLLPAAFREFVVAEEGDWKGLGWPQLQEQTSGLLSDQLMRRVTLNVSRLAGIPPRHVLSAANALQWVPTRAGGRTSDPIATREALSRLDEILSRPGPSEVGVVGVLAEMNALIRFLNWVPLIECEENFSGLWWTYSSVCDTATQLLQTLDQHPEVWQEGFAAVFATVLRPQLEGLDAVSAVGRFLIQLVVKEGKLREEFFSGVDLEWHNRTVELVTQPPTELEEVTLDCSY